MKKSVTFYVAGCTDIKKVLNEIAVSGIVQEAAIEAYCNIERKWAVSCDNCHKKPVKLKVTVEVRRERGSACVLNTGLKFETLIKRSVRMEGVVKRFVQGAEKRNLTLDQYLDLLLNLHDLYDKTVNMHKGIIDNLSSLDAIKNEWRIGSQDELQRISAI